MSQSAYAKRAMDEEIGAVASDAVRERVVREALAAAGLDALPEDPEQLRLFVQGALRDRLDQVLGPDDAEQICDRVASLLERSGPITIERIVLGPSSAPPKVSSMPPGWHATSSAPPPAEGSSGVRSVARFPRDLEGEVPGTTVKEVPVQVTASERPDRGTRATERVPTHPRAPVCIVTTHHAGALGLIAALRSLSVRTLVCDDAELAPSGDCVWVVDGRYGAQHTEQTLRTASQRGHKAIVWASSRGLETVRERCGELGFVACEAEVPPRELARLCAQLAG